MRHQHPTPPKQHPGMIGMSHAAQILGTTQSGVVALLKSGILPKEKKYGERKRQLWPKVEVERIAAELKHRREHVARGKSPVSRLEFLK